MRILNLLLVIFFLSSVLLAQVEIPNIAVMDLEGNGVSATEIAGLTNRLRTELFNTGSFKVIERSQMDQILKEQKFQLTGCTSSECAVEVGQLLGVQFMVVGSVDRVGTLFSANIRLVNVETGEIEKSALDDCRNCQLEDVMITTLRNAAARLAGKGSQAPSPMAAPAAAPAAALAAVPAAQNYTQSVEYKAFRRKGLLPSAWQAYKASGMPLDEFYVYRKYKFDDKTWAQYKESGLNIKDYLKYFKKPGKWEEYKASGQGLNAWAAAQKGVKGGFDGSSRGILIGGGLNSSIRLSDVADFNDNAEARMGYNIGLGVEFSMSSKLSVVAGGALETRGDEFYDEYNDTYAYTNLTYLQFPFMLQFNSSMGVGVLNLFAGPEFGFLLSANLEYMGLESDIKDAFNTFDYGLTMGVGLEFPVSSGSIFFRPNLYIGFVNLDESEMDTFSNMNMQLKAGYKFGL